jgi:hypothetical protein
MSEEKKAKKEDLAEELRNILGVDVKFEKLSSSDIQKLYDVLTKVFSLAEIGVRMMANRVRGITERELFNKPLREILKEGSILGILRREGGLFGLNILPNILERWEKGSILKSTKEEPSTKSSEGSS